jgi:hypothetical protein
MERGGMQRGGMQRGGPGDGALLRGIELTDEQKAGVRALGVGLVGAWRVARPARPDSPRTEGRRPDRAARRDSTADLTEAQRAQRMQERRAEMERRRPPRRRRARTARRRAARHPHPRAAHHLRRQRGGDEGAPGAAAPRAPGLCPPPPRAALKAATILTR